MWIKFIDDESPPNVLAHRDMRECPGRGDVIELIVDRGVKGELHRAVLTEFMVTWRRWTPDGRPTSDESPVCTVRLLRY
jgi:hypothetical protein